MPQIKNRSQIIIEKPAKVELLCYHCGTPCITANIAIQERIFCCEGCKLVYELLNEKGLCDYYKLQSHPGLSKIKPVRDEKYTYLDNADIAKRLFKFTDGNRIIATFYLPAVHCSSCMWLLEHLPKLNRGIVDSRLNFAAKEVTIQFLKEQITLRQVVELLATIGYEPLISLDDADKKKAAKPDRQRLYKLGVAGFCFGNIMMISFPEYLSHHSGIDQEYATLFRILNLILSVPVFFYSGSEFFVTAWKGLKQKMLNIDAPIALALLITYSRSIYEILSGTGSGYLDSMSGIVFFMLIGRLVQERTYKSISFHRDYKSYFPIAVDVVTPSGVASKSLQDLKEKDVVQLHNDEIIPADAIVVSGSAKIDYSFVTGESAPISINAGEQVYAGGRQVGGLLTIQIVKPVAGSYLTSLWNHQAFLRNKIAQNSEQSTVHLLSRYFTYILLTLAASAAIYWWVHDARMILPSVSAMLIVACPCALLLSATYTNGNLLRLFSNNGLFLRDATVIEQLGNINHIVFDKTGTLTRGNNHITYTGHQLSEEEKDQIYTIACASRHPYSKALADFMGSRKRAGIEQFREMPGSGIEAMIGQTRIRIGSALFSGVIAAENDNASFYVRINDNITTFCVLPDFRTGIPEMIAGLNNDYGLSLLSGDNNSQKVALQKIFDNNSELLFKQKPIDKLNYIENLQNKGNKVLMIGDGLNDAGGLQQSNVGITLTDDINNFTPSCDAILDAKKITALPALLKLARYAKAIIGLSFACSIAYNVIGLCIAARGMMNPMIAAILMPASTLSIVLITTGISSLTTRFLGLSLNKP